MSYRAYWSPRTYPPARRSSTVNEYNSAKGNTAHVPDPYDWLELDTPETQAWVSKQEAYTRSFLDRNPERAILESNIRTSWDYERIGHPTLVGGGRWYWFYNSGLQAQDVCYRSKDSVLPSFSDVKGGEVFFDPNVLSKDGSISLKDYAFSPDGKYFAYSLSTYGTEEVMIYVWPTTARMVHPDNVSARLPDEIQFVKFSTIDWTRDGTGFFYQRFPRTSADKVRVSTESDLDAMMYYHRIGTDQSDDVLIMRDATNRTHMWDVIESWDAQYLYLYVYPNASEQNLVWVADRTIQSLGSDMHWTKLVSEFEFNYTIIGNDGPKLYLMTNANALRYKVISVDLDDFAAAGENAKIADVARDLIPEAMKAKLSSAVIVGGSRLALTYQCNAKHELYIHSLRTGGRLARLAENHVGTISVSGHQENALAIIQACNS